MPSVAACASEAQMTHRGYEQLDFLGTRSSFGGQRSIGGAAIVTDRESTRPKQQVGTDLARGFYGRALPCQGHGLSHSPS